LWRVEGRKIAKGAIGVGTVGVVVEVRGEALAGGGKEVVEAIKGVDRPELHYGIFAVGSVML
jgi:hypothetical protein